MKVLTANNEIVQKYVAQPNKEYKELRFETLLNGIYEAAVESIYKLFTAATKRVIDEIIYLSSGAGICKIGAESLAERCGVSVATVYKAVRGLKKSGEFTVARIADGHAGKYIFVDHAHGNYARIMKEVFHQEVEAAEMPQKTTEQGLEQGLQQGLENGSEPTAPSVSDEKNEPIFNISNIYSLKQVNNNYNNNAHACEAIKELETEEQKALKDEIETESIANNSREYLEQYATNDMQLAFYDRIMLFEGLYPSQVTENAALLALRLGSNCSKERYARAKDLIHSIAMQITEGSEYFENVVAAFTAALNNAENYRSVPKAAPKYETGDRTKEQNLAKQSIKSFADMLRIDINRGKEQWLAKQSMNQFASFLGTK